MQGKNICPQICSLIRNLYYKREGNAFKGHGINKQLQINEAEKNCLGRKITIFFNTVLSPTELSSVIKL